MAWNEARGAVVRPVGIEEDQGSDGFGACTVAVQRLMAAARERLASLDLSQKDRTGQDVRSRRKQERQAAGSLDRWIEIDQRMPPAASAGRRPLVDGAYTGVEGGPQRIAPSRRHGTAEQEITVAGQCSGLIGRERIDLGGRDAMPHQRSINFNV
ncbi:hypothetical protein GCM10010987_73140 [Bradyrhizobium guangdongense]|uniref:Uncharacterized protein n=1 Tax=Bradyrhizobium guangdongense TaxID=1325090 RepID=A0AA87WCE8_9BRAD|nr:hypothetical protein GCM10010987_73140 [Bradyrhizobium guangdongense]